MKNTLLKGSLILIVAGFFGKALGALYRLPLSSILGAEGIGIYQMVFSVFSLGLILCSGGISASISYQIASSKAKGQSPKKVFVLGFLYALISSLICALIFVLLGQQIAALQGFDGGKLPYILAGITLVFASVIASFRGLFQGQQNMVPTAVSQILEQLCKVCFGLLFAGLLLQKGLIFGVVGALLGVLIGEVFAFFYLFLKSRKVDFAGQAPQKISFLKTNFFFTAGAIIIPLVIAFDSFVVVNILKNFMSTETATALFGLESGIVSSLINFPVVASIGISLALLPELSLLVQTNTAAAKQNIEKMFALTFAFCLPVVLVFVFFAKDIFLVLYPRLDANFLETGILLLRLSALQVMFIAITQLSTSVLQSLGKAKTVMFVLLFGAVVKCGFTTCLVGLQSVNIFGLAISFLVFYGLTAVLLTYFAKKSFLFQVGQKVLVFGSTFALVLSASFWGINVYFDSVLAKICFGGVAVLIFYVLPLYASDFMGVKAYMKTIFQKRVAK